MCKYKDTTLEIKKLDFNVKRGAMAVFLTDGREVIVPVKMFPEIKNLSKKQREDYMIMDAINIYIYDRLHKKRRDVGQKGLWHNDALYLMGTQGTPGA